MRLKRMCSKRLAGGSFSCPNTGLKCIETFSWQMLYLTCFCKTGFYLATQVDTSAHKMPTDGPMWLRLVQSARSSEEQNLEAYVKNGQLFFRALRTIQKEEERLVWYGKDLAKLFLLNHCRYKAKVCLHTL